MNNQIPQQVPPQNPTTENSTRVNSPPAPKSFLSKKIILIVVILVIFLGAGGTYFVLNSQNKPTPTIAKTEPISTPTSTIENLNPNSGNLYEDIKIRMNQVMK